MPLLLLLLVAAAGTAAVVVVAGDRIRTATIVGPRRVSPPSTNTRPAGRPTGSGRAFSKKPEPGKWVRITKPMLRPLVVFPADMPEDVRGVRIKRPDQVLAWRAYASTQPPTKRKNKNEYKTHWKGLDPLLGLGTGAKTLLGLKSDVEKNLVQAGDGDWASLAQDAAATIQKGIKGLKDRYDAAQELVVHLDFGFLANISSDPDNASIYYSNESFGGAGLTLEEGTEVYIPMPGEWWPREGEQFDPKPDG